VAGENGDTRVLAVSGWVVGDSAPVSVVEISAAGTLLWTLPVHDRRPDVADIHPGVEWAVDAGFSGAVGLLRLPSSWTIELVARAEGRATRIATIAGRRAPLEPAEHTLDPLIVTTLGRTGSSWLIHLLAQHPDVVAYRPFSFEPRAATYWMEALMALAEPAAYTQQIDGDITDAADAGPWWLGTGTSMTSELLPEGELADWLGSHAIDELAAFAHGRIDALYTRVAAATMDSTPTCFAEKCLPGRNVQPLLAELYPGFREIFLVRDPRDIVCSIQAFNAKRGRAAFGADNTGVDAEYVRERLAPSVMNMSREWRARSESAHLVRYEDLVQAPGRVLSGLLGHVGLEASAGTVAAMVQHAQTEAPGMSDHRTVGSASASVGRWRTELREDLRDACEDVFGEVLEEFGYEQ
jgi:hypothetical protein